MVVRRLGGSLALPGIDDNGWSDFVAAEWLDLAGKFGPLPRGG